MTAEEELEDEVCEAVDADLLSFRTAVFDAVAVGGSFGETDCEGALDGFRCGLDEGFSRLAVVGGAEAAREVGTLVECHGECRKGGA